MEKGYLVMVEAEGETLTFTFKNKKDLLEYIDFIQQKDNKFCYTPNEVELVTGGEGEAWLTEVK